MYFAYGCPKVLCLRPKLIPEERILAVSFNPPGSLLAIASTSRVCLWSGGKDHFPLSSLPLQLRDLPGKSLLWKRDSSVLAVVSSAGKLVLLSVKPKPGERPASERFSLPDWLEPQHTRMPMETDGGERDAWADPGDANMAVASTVEAIGSEASAMCLGRFGQHVLVGTESGAIYGVSWEGQILCCLDIIAVPSAPPRSGSAPGPRSPADRARLADLGAVSSMSFNDTLQLLALTTEDGSFFLGTLSKNSCWLRNIAVTEQGHVKNTSAATAATTVAAGERHPDLDIKQIRRGWGWRLLGTGREAVAAATAATAATSLRANGTTGANEASSATAGAAVAGAVGVEFSPKGLMAVAIVDGTVLLARVERYTSGLRSLHKLHISDSMLHRTDSHRLEAYQADEKGAKSSAERWAESREAPPRPPPSPGREGSLSSLWGVEVHHLYCLSLNPWLGPGGDPKSEAAGPAGRVLSMCFSSDGWALAVGHERALTVWSTEDGTRLVCTTSNSDYDPSKREKGGDPSHAPPATATASVLPTALANANGDIRAQRHEADHQHLPGWPSRATSGGRSLDLVSGGARALTWDSEGYRLVSVGAEVVRAGTEGEEEEEGGGEGVGAASQGIMALDFLRRARSNLSSALLTLQGSDRIAMVDSQPWSAQVLLWRVLPVHPGYLAANAPLRHVSTSRAGTHVAVAGARGLAVYSRPTNRWRLFGNIQQEQEVQVAGMCWWGESAIVVVSRVKHAFILLLYPRNHLNSEALLLSPIKLPVGMRPLFMQGAQEGGSKPDTDVLFLLVAGSTSYLLYRFSCTGALESGNVTYGVLHEGPLPHVLGNMGDRLHPEQLQQPRLQQQQSAPPATTGAPTSANGAKSVLSGSSQHKTAVHKPEPSGSTDGSGAQKRTSVDDDRKRTELSTGSVRSRVAVINGGGRERDDRFGVDQRGEGTDLPVIGPPKRVMLLPEVHPRTIALLDYDGNLVTMDTSNGEVKAVADGVESVIDLSGVSEAWEALETPLLVHPCYLLRTKGRVEDGEYSGAEEMAQEFSVWCPAMRLDPCPPSVRRLLTPGRSGGGDGEAPSPVFSLEPGTSCDPERVDLGLQPLLGTMVLASQVVCPSRVSNTPPLPPCFEIRTHLRPILHMVLRHLLIASQFQLLDSPSILSPASPGANRLLGSPGTAGGTADDGDAVSGFVETAAKSAVIAAVGTEAGANDGAIGRVSNNHPVGPGSSSKGGDIGKEAESTRGTGDGEAKGEADGVGRHRDWIGTSSDAFEIAIAVLKRCRQDAVLVEALPDTLELLLRSCMEGVHLAGERAKTEAIAARRERARNRNAKGSGSVNGNGISNSSSSASAAAVSELELARAVMTDSVYLAQLAPECFHEVVARVARKAEPERYALMFPLHRAVGEEDSQQQASAAEARRDPQEAANGNGGYGNGDSGRLAGREGGQLEAGGLGPSWGRLVHPTHLFHECVTAGRLTTAAWYLPLVRDDVAYDAARRHAGPDGPFSDEERRRCMPLEMWAMTGKDWSFGLSHALSCVLLSASLSSNQHAFLPEVWLFARKREQSAPHHHQNYRHRDHPRHTKLGQSEEGMVFDHQPPWYRRGQGAAIEAAQVRAEKLKKVAFRVVGASFEPREALASPVPESALMCGEDTYFGRTSRLRLRALRRLSSGSGKEAEEENRSRLGNRLEAAAPVADSLRGAGLQSTLPQRSEAERTRLYYLPLTRDAASVVSRFMWQELNDLRVKTVLKAFQSLASSPAAREAGLTPGHVLSALAPARRSMVGSLPSSPVETMAGLMVALAQMFKVNLETLALVAAPVEELLSPEGDDNSPVEKGAPSDRPISTPGVSGAPTTASYAPSAPGTGSRGASGAPSAHPSLRTEGKGGSPTAAQIGARDTVAASVCPQLELLGDLSRSVGHGEAALICATLLRDEARTTETLSNASQTLRVGYGRFISDFVEQLEFAKNRTGLADETDTAWSKEGKDTQARKGAGVETTKGKVGSSSSSRLRKKGGVGPLAVVMGLGEEAGAMALIRLQRFGGKCLGRSLAHGGEDR